MSDSMHPDLARWMRWLGATNWAALILDARGTLVWVSDEFKRFLHEDDDSRLGVGQHVLAAMASPTWMRTLTPDGMLEVVHHALPFFLDEVGEQAEELLARLDEPLRAAICSITPQPQPDLWSGRFEYVPGPELPPYMVHYLVTRVRDTTGALVGSCMVTQMGLRPTLLSMLARGDERVYERMERLVTPGRRQAAMLFADLQSSGDMSRRMSTARYFGLIQSMTAEFEAAVTEHGGVAGKHAGDGWTGFFLADDAGSAEDAAAAAIVTALRLQRAAADVGEQLALGATRLLVNVGLHYGANVFMGQLVPAGRLDVTALGDEVNECARVQEAARDGSVLATKPLLELLSPERCASLGVDSERLTYEPLGSIEGVSAKAIRDAGTLAVARLARCG